jgi:class 3 adenylate cyclase
MNLLLRRAERDELHAAIARHGALALEIRQPYVLGWAARFRAGLSLLEGRLADARREAWESRSHTRRTDEEAATQLFGLQLFWLRWMQGRLGELEPGVRAGLARFPENPVWRALLTVLLAETGQREEARREIDVIADRDFATTGANVFGADGPLYLVAEACSDVGYALYAPRLYELLLPCSREVCSLGTLVVMGGVGRALGNLAALMGRLDEAVTHFEEALELETRLCARGLLPRTQCAAARTLLARQGKGDRRRALALLDEALDTSRELGLKGWLDRCLALKFEAQGLDSSSLSAKGTIDAIAASLGADPPDFSAHAASDGSVTLMFSDIEDFTRLTSRLGDRRAHEVIGRHNAIVREQLARHEGREVELQGDGFLLAFAEPHQALRCAVAIQRALEEHNVRYANEAMRVRIGLHTGEAIRDRGRFFGLSVILAARVASEASGGQILVSAAVKERNRKADEFRFAAERRVSLKGIDKLQRILEVLWDPDA